MHISKNQKQVIFEYVCLSKHVNTLSFKIMSIVYIYVHVQPGLQRYSLPYPVPPFCLAVLLNVDVGLTHTLACARLPVRAFTRHAETDRQRHQMVMS